MKMLESISEALQRGDADQIALLTRRALDDRVEPKEILDRALIAGMTAVGEKYRDHLIFLPDVLLAARAMHRSMDIVKPLMVGEESSRVGTVVMGSVQGDIHDIGKNLVCIMLQGAGFEVIDLGNDVPPEEFVNAAAREKADVIGLSALLTTTMPVMSRVVDLVKERKFDRQIGVMVGGAPVTEEFSRQIGADGYGVDSSQAVEVVRKLVREKNREELA
jgi:5-methyltetrahydrofolate--homocysteine methyltransferase